MGVEDATNLSPLLKLKQTLSRTAQGRQSALPVVTLRKSDRLSYAQTCTRQQVLLYLSGDGEGLQQ